MAKLPEIKITFQKILSVIVLLMACNLVYLNWFLFSYVRSNQDILNPNLVKVLSGQDVTPNMKKAAPKSSHANESVELDEVDKPNGENPTGTSNITEEWILNPSDLEMLIESR